MAHSLDSAAADTRHQHSVELDSAAAAVVAGIAPAAVTVAAAVAAAAEVVVAAVDLAAAHTAAVCVAVAAAAEVDASAVAAQTRPTAADKSVAGVIGVHRFVEVVDCVGQVDYCSRCLDHCRLDSRPAEMGKHQMR